MKKFFLFVATIAAFSLASCGGGDASSVPDGNSLNPGIDPNDGTRDVVDPNNPANNPPQVNDDSNNAPTIEENNASSVNKDSTNKQ